ncbi:MAG: NYN domain-containing protein [bacterium]
MDDNIKKILKTIHGFKIGVFIDNSNLYHAQKDAGWWIDWKKFKLLLQKQLDISFYNFYIAIPSKSDVDYRSTKAFTTKLKEFSAIKTKPMKYIKTRAGVLRKGDVDVEIVLDVVRNVNNLDVIMIVAGDSDYLELKNWVIKDNKKKIIFIAYENNMAWELRQCWHIYLNRIRKEIELKK